MGSQSLFLQALMNNFVKGYANQQLATEEATESPGSPKGADEEPGAAACAMRLFALTLKSLRSSTAPAINAKDLVARHTRKRLQLKKKASGCEQPDVAGVFETQAARLRKLNKELAAYSKGQLERVDDAKTAKKLIRMFDLPQEMYQEWNEGRRRRGTKSPSPRQSRKRKSPEGGLPPRQPTPSRFAPPGSHVAAGGGSSSGLLVPKRLFVWDEQIADDVATGAPLGQAKRAQRGTGGPPPKAGIKVQAAVPAPAAATAAAGPSKRKPRKPAAPKPSAASSCERPSGPDPARTAELLPWKAFMAFVQQPTEEQQQQEQQPVAQQQACNALSSDAFPGLGSCGLDTFCTMDCVGTAACAASDGAAAVGAAGPAQAESLVPLLAVLEQSAAVPAAEPFCSSPFALQSSLQPAESLASAGWGLAGSAADLGLTTLTAAGMSPESSAGPARSSCLASWYGSGSCEKPSALAVEVERLVHIASTSSAGCWSMCPGGAAAPAVADGSAAAGEGCWAGVDGLAAAASSAGAAARAAGDTPCPQAALLHLELAGGAQALPDVGCCRPELAVPAQCGTDMPEAAPALAAVSASQGSPAAANVGSALLPVLAPAQRCWRDLQCPPSPKAEAGAATVPGACTPSEAEPAAGRDTMATAGAAPSEQQGQVGSNCGAASADSPRRCGSSINPLEWGFSGGSSSRGAKRRRAAAAPDSDCGSGGCSSSDSEGEEGACDGVDGDGEPAREALALALLGHRGAAFACGPVSNKQVVVEASRLRLHSRRESPFSAAARQAFEGMSLLQQRHAAALSRPLQLSF